MEIAVRDESLSINSRTDPGEGLTPRMCMSFYDLPFEEFRRHRDWPFALVADVDALNRRIAEDAVSAIQAAGNAGNQILIITPTGPLDYTYLGESLQRAQRFVSATGDTVHG